jgi:hypothetical protein
MMGWTKKGAACLRAGWRPTFRLLFQVLVVEPHMAIPLVSHSQLISQAFLTCKYILKRPSFGTRSSWQIRKALTRVTRVEKSVAHDVSQRLVGWSKVSFGQLFLRYCWYPNGLMRCRRYVSFPCLPVQTGFLISGPGTVLRPHPGFSHFDTTAVPALYYLLFVAIAHLFYISSSPSLLTT